MLFFTDTTNEDELSEEDEEEVDDSDASLDDEVLAEIGSGEEAVETDEAEGFGIIEKTEEEDKEEAVVEEEEEEEDNEELEDDAEDVDYDRFDDVDEM